LPTLGRPGNRPVSYRNNGVSAASQLSAGSWHFHPPWFNVARRWTLALHVCPILGTRLSFLRRKLSVTKQCRLVEEKAMRGRPSLASATDSWLFMQSGKKSLGRIKARECRRGAVDTLLQTGQDPAGHDPRVVHRLVRAVGLRAPPEHRGYRVAVVVNAPRESCPSVCWHWTKVAGKYGRPLTKCWTRPGNLEHETAPGALVMESHDVLDRSAEHGLVALSVGPAEVAKEELGNVRGWPRPCRVGPGAPPYPRGLRADQRMERAPDRTLSQENVKLEGFPRLAPTGHAARPREETARWNAFLQWLSCRPAAAVPPCSRTSWTCIRRSSACRKPSPPWDRGPCSGIASAARGCGRCAPSFDEQVPGAD